MGSSSDKGERRPPGTVGNYRITRLLGEGGMGSVFLGVHPDIKSEVAIKVLHSHLVTDSDMVRRFIDEARAVNQVKHPGIVRIHDCAEQEGVGLYLVMELLEGRTLAEHVKENGPLEARIVVRIVRQVASVLAAVHREGIVHRDLKPGNIMLVADPDVTGGERAKVLDFGIAKLWEGTHKSKLETDPCMVMGSVGYMSPEQCLDFRDVDHRTDIYSLGVIAYELLCGRVPFQARTTVELAAQHRAARPEAPGERLSGVSPALDRVVMKALAVEPSQRYQSMVELGEALRAALEPGAAVEPARPQWLSPRSKLVLLVATICVVALDVVLLLTILRDDGPGRKAPAARERAVGQAPVRFSPDTLPAPDSGTVDLARPNSAPDLSRPDAPPPPDQAAEARAPDVTPPARVKRRRRRAWKKRRRRRRRPRGSRRPARGGKKRPGKQPGGDEGLPYDDL